MSDTVSIKQMEAQIAANQKETREILTGLLGSLAKDRSTITRSRLKNIALSLGLTPGEVSEIVLTPREVRVTCIDKSAVPWATTTRTIPVVP